jgi:hypothetical protein
MIGSDDQRGVTDQYAFESVGRFLADTVKDRRINNCRVSFGALNRNRTNSTRRVPATFLATLIDSLVLRTSVPRASSMVRSAASAPPTTTWAGGNTSPATATPPARRLSTRGNTSTMAGNGAAASMRSATARWASIAPLSGRRSRMRPFEDSSEFVAIPPFLKMPLVPVGTPIAELSVPPASNCSPNTILGVGNK